ncbi:MAG: ankyrin repeat domain-containing protein [Candidatus Anstonellales archaeon]
MINIGAIIHGNRNNNISVTKINIDENDAHKIMSISSKDDIIRIMSNLSIRDNNDTGIYLLTMSYLLNAHKAFDILIDEFGVDINSPIFKGVGINGCDLTILNIERGDITKEMEEILLKHIHRFKFIENKDVRGFTPIFIASNNGNIRLANVLIGLKPNLNITDIYGSTPLKYALIRNDYDMAKLLLENGSDPNTLVRIPGGYMVTHLYSYILSNIYRGLDFDILLLMIIHGAKLFSIEFLLNKNKYYSPCVLDAISECIENEESLSRYVCSRKLYNKSFSRLLRTAIFTKNFYRENTIQDVIINFRSRRNSSTRDFVSSISMIFNSIVDNIKHDDIYNDINIMNMDLYNQSDRIKFLRYKMCL